MNRPCILVADDEFDTYYYSLKHRIQNAELDSAGTPSDAISKLKDKKYHYAVVDLHFKGDASKSSKELEHYSGRDIILECRKQGTTAVVYSVVDFSEIEEQLSKLSVLFIRKTRKYTVEGRVLLAEDYLVKVLDELISTGEKAYTFEQFKEIHKIVGRSVGLMQVVDTIQKYAPTPYTVLIRGENGVGKEIVARALHYASRRADKEFFPLNCGALPKSTIESELFGHEKGAFTGAINRKLGIFEAHAGGTVFLDEIATFDTDIQVKLLRFLENHEFIRVGSSKVLTADVRVITATNENLEERIIARTLREDFYFRLCVLTLWVLPLRERRQDIFPLLEYFVQEHTNTGITFGGFSKEAKTLMHNYDWPGNVRQLKNTVISSIVESRGKEVSAAKVADILKIDPKDVDKYDVASGMGATKGEEDKALPPDEIENCCQIFKRSIPRDRGGHPNIRAFEEESSISKLSELQRAMIVIMKAYPNKSVQKRKLGVTQDPDTILKGIRDRIKYLGDLSRSTGGV